MQQLNQSNQIFQIGNIHTALHSLNMSTLLSIQFKNFTSPIDESKLPTAQKTLLRKLNSAFELFTQSSQHHTASTDQNQQQNRYIESSELGTLLRYVSLFPTESELQNQILPLLTAATHTKQSSLNLSSKNQSVDQTSISQSMLSQSVVVPFMFHSHQQHLYEPDSNQTLLTAFQILDTEKNNYIDSSVLHDLLLQSDDNPEGLTEKEIEEFFRVAKDPDTGFIHYEGKLIPQLHLCTILPLLNAIDNY